MSKIAVLAAIAIVFGLVAYAGAGNPTAFNEPGRGNLRSYATLLAGSHQDLLTRHTESYVREDTDEPACSLLQEQFADLTAKGLGEFRLMALTAEPIVEHNLPANEFETRAAAELRSGKAAIEQTLRHDGQQVLHSATAIRVTSQRCALCHPNFKGLPADQAVGAFSYRLPID